MIIAPGDNTRERFTGKEYEIDGNENGAAGLQLTYFGARFYDPEIGIWNSTDPKSQSFNEYAYCGGNPVIFIDPNGKYWIGAIIGAVIGAYAGGVMSNDFQFNPGKWNWEEPGTYLGMIGGAISGAGIGSSIENSMVSSYIQSDLAHIPKTEYGLKAYAQSQGGALSMRNRNIQRAWDLQGEGPLQQTLDYC